jgi:hypothetical protein
MEIFKEAVAGIQRVAVLGNGENPLHRFLWDDLQPIGPALGLQVRLFAVSGLDKLPAVFSTIKQDGFDAMTLLSDAQFFSARRQIRLRCIGFQQCTNRGSLSLTAGLSLWSEYS